MTNAAALSLIAVCAQLITAGLFFAVSRAPGWRVARRYALLPLTAAVFSLGNSVYGFEHAPWIARAAAMSSNFLMACLHVVLWQMVAFGGPGASFRAMPRPLRWLCALTLGLGALSLLGLPVHPERMSEIVSFAGGVYVSPANSVYGDVVAFWLLVMLCVPFAALVRRARGGDRASLAQALGFAVFLLCALQEVVVSMFGWSPLYFGDIGLLSGVLPLAFNAVRRVVDDAERLEARSGQLATEVEVRTRERDLAHDALAANEHYAALGRLAAGVAHEINNPLTFVYMSLDEIEQWAADPGAPAGLDESVLALRTGIQRIQNVVASLKSWHPVSPLALHPTQPRALVDAALRLAAPSLPADRVAVRAAECPLVTVDAGAMVRVLEHLLKNAGQAVAEAPGPTASVTVRCAGEEGGTTIEVSDEGPGMPPDVLRRLSEPYFTTRARSGALGLGLFLARGVVSQHGGRLTIRSEPGRGTSARVWLPASTPEAVSGASP